MSDIEKQRNMYVQQYKSQIRELEGFIRINNNKITNLRGSSFVRDYINTTTETIQNQNKIYEDEIQELNKKIISINVGNSDLELKEKKQTIKAIQNKNETIKKEKKEMKINHKQQQQKVYNKQNIERKNDRQHYKDMNYALRHFYKAEDTLPNYMRRNLADMPNNKGYIWKGVYFYGDLPAEDDKDSMLLFEKPSKDVLLIHEWKEDTYNVFKKMGSNRKELIKSEYRHSLHLSKIHNKKYHV